VALVPEFFTLLGIEIFLAISVLSGLLDRQLPSRLQYIFQGLGGLGFAQLLVSIGMFSGPASTYQIRFWVSIVYLGFALSCVIGTNVYLFVGRRGATVASAFSSAVTVPFLLVSALFISSFLGSRDVTFSPAAISTLAFLMVIVSVSAFGFLREFSKRMHPTVGIGSLPASPLSIPRGTPDEGIALNLSSAKETEWEESPKKKESDT
jgi:hypothetical protein